MSDSELRSAELRASIALPAAPAAVRSARRWTEGLLARTDPGDLVDTAVLLVSELVTNAILASCDAAPGSGCSGPGRIELAIARSSATIRIEVTDSACRSFPELARPGADGEGGRGLQVIATLSRRWGCHTGPGGKVVWCELPAARPGPDAFSLAGGEICGS